MATNGLLLEVRWQWNGTELTADVDVDSTVLPVLNADVISKGSQIWVQDSGPYVVAGVGPDGDTVTLSTGLDALYEEGSAVVPDVGGMPGQVWVAEVMLPDAERPIEVPLTVHDLLVIPEGVYDPPAAIVLSDDLSTVVDLPGQTPLVDGGDYLRTPYLFGVTVPAVDIPIPDDTWTVIPSASWITFSSADDYEANPDLPGAFKVKRTGLYIVTIGVRWRSNSTGRRAVKSVRHTFLGDFDNFVDSRAGEGTAAMSNQSVAVIPLSIGESVSFEVLQTSTASLDLIGDECRFALVWAGRT